MFHSIQEKPVLLLKGVMFERMAMRLATCVFVQQLCYKMLIDFH